MLNFCLVRARVDGENNIRSSAILVVVIVQAPWSESNGMVWQPDISTPHGLPGFSVNGVAQMSNESLQAKLARVRWSASHKIDVMEDCSERTKKALYAVADLLVRDRCAEVLVVCETAINDDPNQWRLWDAKGKAQSYLGQFTEAVESLTRAVILKPRSEELWCRLAGVLIRMERSLGAIGCYLVAARLGSLTAADAMSDCKEYLKLRGVALDLIDSFASQVDQLLAVDKFDAPRITGLVTSAI